NAESAKVATGARSAKRQSAGYGPTSVAVPQAMAKTVTKATASALPSFRVRWDAFIGPVNPGDRVGGVLTDCPLLRADRDDGHVIQRVGEAGCLPDPADAL